MLLEIAQPFKDGKNWTVAGNPVKFKGFRSLNFTAPGLNEHKKFYADNLHSIHSNQQSILFEPEQKDYQCKITFWSKDKKVLDCNACSFSWLKSRESYLICSIRKSDFATIKSRAITTTFYFSKATKVHDDYEHSIDSLNKKMSHKNLSDISFVNCETETLIVVKT